MRFLISLFLFAFVSSSFAAKPLGIRLSTATIASSGLLDPIPSTNLVDWYTYTGLENNTYPTRTTIYTNLDTNGISSTNINAALVAAPTNTIVLLTNKTFWQTGATEVGIQMISGKTLRGAGPGQTFLVISNNFLMGSEEGRNRKYNNIFSGAIAGSSNITVVSNLTDVIIGQPILITYTNDWNYIQPNGFEGGFALLNSSSDDGNNAYMGDGANLGMRSSGELTKLVSISNNTNLVIWPPLVDPYTNTPARIEYILTGLPSGGSVVQHAGLENLTIKSTLRQLRLYGVQGCWLSNVVVEIYGGDTPSTALYWSHRTLIEHCAFIGFNSRASAIVPLQHRSGTRIQNCIFSNVYQGIIHEGRSANDAFVYNYVGSTTNSTTAQISESGSHGAHVKNALWEGYIGFSIDFDSIHGSGSKQIVFKSYLLGEVPGYTTSGYGCLKIDSFNPWTSVVGCILGHAAMSGWNYEEIAPGNTSSNSIFNFDYSGNDSSVNTGRISKATSILHANVIYTNGSPITVNDVTRTNALTNSYIFASRPSFWGTNIPWPMTVRTNPALWRALYGTNSF